MHRIKLRRGTKSQIQNDNLLLWEPAFTTDTNELCVQGATGKIFFHPTNADTVDNYHASQTPAANTIPVAGSDGKLDSGWLPAGSSSVNLSQVIAIAFFFGGD